MQRVPRDLLQNNKEETLMMKRLTTAATMLLASSVLFGGLASAESFPTRPVTLVVPFATGGSNDIVARLLAKQLSDIWKQPVIIDNKPGAGAAIGSAFVAKQAPDGYTLLIASVTFTMSPAVRSLPFDPVNDFSRIGLIGEVPLALGAKPTVTTTTPQEYFAYLKALPQGSYGATGVGSIQHFAGELLNKKIGSDIQVVQYKGGGPAMNDVMGGHIEFSIGSLTQMLPQFKSGNIKGIAVTSAERSPAAPDLPTLKESGLTDYDLTQWWAVLGPKGMSEDRIAQVNNAIREAVTSADMAEALAREGGTPRPMTPAEFSKFMDNNFSQWKTLATETGMVVKQ
jgi:tripartite-type tricarboxylate transporter receptor subunit TctC